MPDTSKPGLRRLRWVLWALVGVAVLAVGWFQVIGPRLAALPDAGTASLGQGDYRLVATDGSAFSQDSLKGSPSAVFFGFTNCPEVCPTTLGDIAGWQQEFAAQGKPLRAFLVTVDPERDTVERMRDYVSWVPGVLGVTGPPDETAKAVRAFRIYARKVATEDGYTMDHSAMVLLFDAAGRYAGMIGYQEDPARTQATLKALLGA